MDQPGNKNTFVERYEILQFIHGSKRDTNPAADIARRFGYYESDNSRKKFYSHLLALEKDNLITRFKVSRGPAHSKGAYDEASPSSSILMVSDSRRVSALESVEAFRTQLFARDTIGISTMPDSCRAVWFKRASCPLTLV